MCQCRLQWCFIFPLIVHCSIFLRHLHIFSVYTWGFRQVNIPRNSSYKRVDESVDSAALCVELYHLGAVIYAFKVIRNITNIFKFYLQSNLRMLRLDITLQETLLKRSLKHKIKLLKDCLTVKHSLKTCMAARERLSLIWQNNWRAKISVSH